MSSITINDTQKVDLTAAFKDAHGNPAVPVALPEWTVNAADSAIVSLAPAVDGLSCETTALGPLGTAKVWCTSQDHAGTIISDSCDVTVVASGPESIVVEPGTPN